MNNLNDHSYQILNVYIYQLQWDGDNVGFNVGYVGATDGGCVGEFDGFNAYDGAVQM